MMKAAGMNDLMNPLLDSRLKGFPHTHDAVRRSDIVGLGWNVLAGDLPLPIALIKRDALDHNLAWMQSQVRAWKIDLAPHGKTTMSPQLFRRQLDAGAWGLSFATVKQLRVGVAAGARHTLITKPDRSAMPDLHGIQALLAGHVGLRIAFLVDSTAQLDLIERWSAVHKIARPFDVLLEIGISGGRTGCRTHAEATTLAARLHASTAVKLVGIECYEGLGVQGTTDHDAPLAAALMDRVEAIALECANRQWFETDEVLISAGGSAIFDLVANRLTPALGRPVRGLLRSGCYVTHDHGHYKRLVKGRRLRLGCAQGESLRPAIEVWALVNRTPNRVWRSSRSAGATSRTTWICRCRSSAPHAVPLATIDVPASWKITGLNDHHASLRWDASDEVSARPAVGERVGLGISHPCTTFDKWHWMPIVENDYRVSDAVSLHF